MRKLNDGVKVILEPLNKESLESHSGHTYFGNHLNEILTQGSLTREEAHKQGYAVFDVIAQETEEAEGED